MSDATTDTRTPDRPTDDHLPPPGVSDEVVEAVGGVTAAFEVIEHARGMLYAFHRLVGRADAELAEALDQLAEAGHPDVADELRAEVVGRNVLDGRWTFQIVEEFDDGYYRTFADAERRTRERLMEGRRHVYEAQLKERNRTHGRPGHEARPEV
ncbi:hypothetical protein GXP71_15170 [Cellulomonas sp. H30R-01]|uniref:hypothetical protein n=1 Tax=Cellulomonas sp. H30R-01 TaxID=2704467 RepID=UPI00138BEA40|nr:hypothetical protein [Cellulomonas sp. H30R-01]QHT57282.1 hypothetical protein GXP71_15170 [Cellulomonas sp. H30R-01]